MSLPDEREVTLFGDEWSCHICRRKRPDEKISVFTRTIVRDRITITENIRYCNDNPECTRQAAEYSFVSRLGEPIERPEE